VRPGGSATWARVDHDLRRAKHMVPGDPPLTVVTEHGNNFPRPQPAPGRSAIGTARSHISREVSWKSRPFPSSRTKTATLAFQCGRASCGWSRSTSLSSRSPSSEGRRSPRHVRGSLRPGVTATDLRTSSPSLRPNNSPLRSRAMAPSQEETPGSISVSRASGRASRATAELAEPLRRGNAKGSHLRFADHRITSFRRRGQDNGEVPGRANKAMDGRPARRLAPDHPTGS